MQNYVSNPSDEMLERLFPANEPTPISISLSSAEKIDRSYSILEATMKEALAGRLQPNIYVMSADCGTGKSSAVQKVIREEKAKGFTGGGIILFLATLNEVESYALACGLDDADYAVYSSDIRYAARGLGRHNANVAPVLFVTQPKARREFAKIKTYADATCFHYNKKPRALAVWDEALTGAEYAYIEISDLMALPAAFKALTDSERKTLYDLAAASMARPAELAPEMT